MSMEGGVFDIRAIRESVQPFFRQWEIALSQGDRSAAEASRDRLRKTCWGTLDETAASKLPGLYLFADNGASEAHLTFQYVGMSAQSLNSRVRAYFRDDSCLDADLIGLPISAIYDVAHRRISGTMNSEPRLVQKFSNDHALTANWMTGCSLFFAGTRGHQANALKAAEGVLTIGAWNLGATLANSKIDCMPRGDLRAEGLKLALEVVEVWRSAGLNAHASDALTEELVRLAASE